LLKVAGAVEIGSGRLKTGLVDLFEEILSRGSVLRVRVTGNSMAPFLKGGEFVTIRRVPAASIRAGDLILFSLHEDSAILHRVIKRKESGSRSLSFITKGDGRSTPEGPVNQQSILGKVCRVEKMASPSGKMTRINMESVPWRIRNYIRAWRSCLVRPSAFRL